MRRQPCRAVLQGKIAGDERESERQRAEQPRQGGWWHGGDRAGAVEARRQSAGDHGAAREHGERAPRLGTRGLAAQHHIVERERRAADQSQPVGERDRQGQPCAPAARGGRRRRGPEDDRRAGGAKRDPEGRRTVEPLAEDEAGEHDGPDRHQVEEQHDADDVADDDRPVEGGVGDARGQHQQPERWRAQQLARRLRPRGRDRQRGEGEDDRRGPEGMQAGLLQTTHWPPRRAPDEGVDDERQRRRPRDARARARRSQCLSRRAIASRCSTSPRWTTQLRRCQARIIHMVVATSTPKTAIDENAVRPNRVMPV